MQSAVRHCQLGPTRARTAHLGLDTESVRSRVVEHEVGNGRVH